MNAADIWNGVTERDEHLHSANFLDVENHPTIKFQSTGVKSIGENDYGRWRPHD